MKYARTHEIQPVVKKTITVIHVIETLSPGGAERMLVTILPELMRQGIKTEVAVLRPPLDLKVDLEAAGIVVHCLPKRWKWSLFGAASDLARLAKERDVDILHSHLYFPTVVTALTRILKLFRGYTHASFHNLAYAGANKKTWKLEARKRLAKVLVQRGIDQPQAVSKKSAEHYAEQYCLDNIIVVNNAYDKHAVGNVESKSGEAIVLPGRLVHEKGHQDLISAVKMLLPNCPPIVFAGDGPLRPQLEAEIRKNSLPITIKGSLGYTEMLQTIATARLVVVPSRFEGFGLTVLEALALGKALVTTDAGGIPEILGELGYKVPVGQVMDLAKALRSALDNDDWIVSQEAKGPKQAANFKADTIARQQIAVYESTISRKA